MKPIEKMEKDLDNIKEISEQDDRIMLTNLPNIFFNSQEQKIPEKESTKVYEDDIDIDYNKTKYKTIRQIIIDLLIITTIALILILATIIIHKKNNNLNDSLQIYSKSKKSPRIILDFEKIDENINESPKIAVVTFAKNEHLYINDWVKYNIYMGVSHIYIINNDDKRSEYIGNYIKPKLKKYVTIIESRGTVKNHVEDHTSIYKKYGKLYDWIAPFDVDEFIDFSKKSLNFKTFIKNFVKKHPDANLIAFNVLTFNDQDICKCLEGDTDIPVYKRFFHYDKRNDFRKICVKTGLDLKYIGAHRVDLKNGSVLKHQYTPSGKVITEDTSMLYDRDDKDVFIKHYQTKTLGEFLKQKYNRTDLDYNRPANGLDYFFRQNSYTKKKGDYVFKKTGINITDDIVYWTVLEENYIEKEIERIVDKNDDIDNKDDDNGNDNADKSSDEVNNN